MKGIQVSTDVSESGNHTKGVLKDHRSSAREPSLKKSVFVCVSVYVCV